MKERAITALAIVLLVAVVFLTKIIIGTTIIFDVFWLLLAAGAAYEMSNILKHQGKNHNTLLLVLFPVMLFGLLYLEIVLKMSAILSGFLILGLILLFVLAGFLITFLSFAKTEQAMRDGKIRTSKCAYAFSTSMNGVLGYLYPSIPLLMLFPINHLAEISYLAGGTIPYVQTLSVLLLALVFLIPFICDTFAYLVGKTFGGPKLCERISPKKTISGFIGGILATILLLVVIYFILASIPDLQPMFLALGIDWWLVAIIGLVGSLICTGGDLFESFLKRKANLKDSGNILPGHGGILDRLDGFIFVVPMITILMLIFIL